MGGYMPLALFPCSQNSSYKYTNKNVFTNASSGKYLKYLHSCKSENDGYTEKTFIESVFAFLTISNVNIFNIISMYPESK